MIILMSQLIKFSNVYSQLKTVEFSIQVAYQLSRLSISSQSHLEFYYNHMQALAEEYAEKDENNKIIHWENGEVQINKARADECLKKLQDLAKLQVEIPDIYFNLSDFGEIKLSPEQFEALIPFIKE